MKKPLHAWAELGTGDGAVKLPLKVPQTKSAIIANRP